jgi:hypothetical protein
MVTASLVWPAKASAGTYSCTTGSRAFGYCRLFLENFQRAIGLTRQQVDPGFTRPELIEIWP